MGTQCHQGAGEAQHQYGRDCYEDQVNGPRVAASADKIEMSGAAFVSICVKVHSSGPFYTARCIWKNTSLPWLCLSPADAKSEVKKTKERQVGRQNYPGSVGGDFGEKENRLMRRGSLRLPQKESSQ